MRRTASSIVTSRRLTVTSPLALGVSAMLTACWIESVLTISAMSVRMKLIEVRRCVPSDPCEPYPVLDKREAGGGAVLGLGLGIGRHQHEAIPGVDARTLREDARLDGSLAASVLQVELESARRKRRPVRWRQPPVGGPQDRDRAAVQPHPRFTGT